MSFYHTNLPKLADVLIGAMHETIQQNAGWFWGRFQTKANVTECRRATNMIAIVSLLKSDLGNKEAEKALLGLGYAISHSYTRVYPILGKAGRGYPPFIQKIAKLTVDDQGEFSLLNIDFQDQVIRDDPNGSVVHQATIPWRIHHSGISIAEPALLMRVTTLAMRSDLDAMDINKFSTINWRKCPTLNALRDNSRYSKTLLTITCIWKHRHDSDFAKLPRDVFRMIRKIVYINLRDELIKEILEMA